MAEVRSDGISELPCKAEAIVEGRLYGVDSGSSYRMTKAAAVNDVISGIAMESSFDAVGAAKTLTAGETALFYNPGCGKVVKVASLASMTWHRDAPVYAAPTASGSYMVSTSSANSAQKIGHYKGQEGLVTAADGDLIDVLLDVSIGGS
jgi:hypothetical protein